MRTQRMVVTVAVLAVLGVSIAVVQLSAAAFTATTSNAGNNWATGTVLLTDDDTDSAMFTASQDLVPGDTEENCIVVSYGGDVAVGVELYGESHATGGDNAATIAGDLNLTIEAGSGGTFGNCTGFTADSTVFTGTLASFDTAHDDTTGTPAALTWAPSTAESKTFRFSVELDTAATASASTAQQTFTWRASAG